MVIFEEAKYIQCTSSKYHLYKKEEVDLDGDFKFVDKFKGGILYF